MIKIGNDVITSNYFHDGTTSIQVPNLSTFKNVIITWNYQNEHEYMLLYYIVNHLRDHCPDQKIYLFMPYIPNARFDRVKQEKEVLTLKWFAQFINDLHFYRVIVADPHSNVAKALINNLYLYNIKQTIKDAIDEAVYVDNLDYVTLVAPDEGAVKRYDLADWGEPYLFGAKERDWDTRALKSYNLIGDLSLIKNHNVFIIDDIFSSGGTLRLAAEELKKKGALNIYAWATHTENSPLINIKPVKRLYTTDSIYRGPSTDEIKVFHLEV